MYGTHYSAPAFAAYYLVREHPEWTLHLHGGKFDEADRSFFSLGETWAGVLRSTADVKEPSRTLTPLSAPPLTSTPLTSPPLPSPPLTGAHPTVLRAGATLARFRLLPDQRPRVAPGAQARWRRGERRQPTAVGAQLTARARAPAAGRAGEPGLLRDAAQLDRPHLWLQAARRRGGGGGQRILPTDVRGEVQSGGAATA